MWTLYQTALVLALLLAGPLLLATRGRHYLPTLAGRLGGHDGPVVPRPVWLHAVSVGEARVGGSVARRLKDAAPLLMTTVTPTGQAEARRQLGSAGVTSYLPFDLGWPIRRFLDRFEPRVCLVVEGDLWPLMLRRLHRRAVPVVVVNGRVGDGTWARLRGRPRLSRAFYGPVDLFLVQTERDAERLDRLGVAPDRVRVTGNLKFDAPLARASPELVDRVRSAAAGRDVLVAGSTMEGEDAPLLEAWREGRREGPPGLLVLAPRHPERWDDVARLAARCGLAVERRSEPSPASSPDLLLLDSLGELAGVYGLADAAFIGGTLVPTGGHNPIEAAAHGVPIAVGPSMENFSEIAERFDAGDAWRRVENARELMRVWTDWRDGGGSELGRRGRELVNSHGGALDRTIAGLTPLLESVDVRVA